MPSMRAASAPEPLTPLKSTRVVNTCDDETVAIALRKKIQREKRNTLLQCLFMLTLHLLAYFDPQGTGSDYIAELPPAEAFPGIAVLLPLLPERFAARDAL